ncbi:hypothetical protein PSTEL_09505 [Paenibacillus stellifer]|uniref:HTH cro/C1-type domain-containing protein n=1 Tax=Paenibacillus stellifer TaxID=169760 RepID=A0A089LT61_9BACL|nr:helix-turn-helix transcriptional regulator [Paenibacillus stellifer]AIQ63290.1 hypothetical protein PSTEL_09505 [Paenibacillus stellifer]
MFGDVLRKLRQERKLNMDEFVKQINQKYNMTFSKSMVSRWENNLTDPRMESVRVIADFFEVSMDDLLELNTDQDHSLKEFESYMANPEHDLFFKELMGAPEERIEDLKKVWEIIKRSSESEDK